MAYGLLFNGPSGLRRPRFDEEGNPLPSEPPPTTRTPITDTQRTGLAAKEAAGDIAPAPSSGAIKAAAGVVSRPRPPINLPQTEGVDPSSTYGLMFRGPTAESVPVAPPPDASRAPTPSLTEHERLLAQAPSYGQYEKEKTSLPTEADYLEEHRPHGFLGRLGAAAKLGGRVLVASGGNPIQAAEGLAIGAIDKDAPARERYRDDVEPRSITRQRRFLGQAEAEQGMSDRIQDRELRREQIQATRDYRVGENERHHAEVAEKIRHDQATEGEHNLNDFWMRFPDKPTPKELATAAGRPFLEGYTPGRKPPTRTYVQTKQGEDGYEYGLTPDGHWEKTTTDTGESFRPYQKPEKETERDYEAEAAGGMNYDAEIKTRMDQWREGHYAQHGITPQMVENAKKSAVPGMPENPDAIRVRQAEAELYKRAEDSVKASVKQKAGQMKSGAGRSRRLGDRTPSSTTAAPTQKRTLSPADVHSFAQANGISDDQARSLLRSNSRFVVP